MGAVGSWPIFSEKGEPIAVLTIHSLNPRYFNPVMIDNVEDLEVISKCLLESISTLETSLNHVQFGMGIVSRRWRRFRENLIRFADKVSYEIKRRGGNSYGILNIEYLLTSWFEKRRSVYSTLNHFRKAEEIHKHVHEKIRSTTITKTDIEVMQRIFRNLYLEMASE